MYRVIIKRLVPLASHQFKLKTIHKITHFAGVFLGVGVTGGSITFPGVFFGVGVTGGSTTFADVFFDIGVTGDSVIRLRVRGLERVELIFETSLSTSLSTSLL
jgi:hypothetical protein